MTPPADRDAYTPASDGDPASLDVFDDQARADGTSQVTARGYDTMTGLGVPNGTAFIAALCRLTAGTP